MKNKEYSLYVLYKNLWFHLNRKHKTQICLVFLLSLFVSFTEFFSVASLLPFIAIFTDIDLALSNDMFSYFVNFFGLKTKEDIYLFSTVTFCLITFSAMLSRITLIISNIRISNNISTYLVQKIFNLSIKQRYYKLLEMDLTNIVSIISNKSNVIASSVFVAIINIINSFFIIFFITIGLFYLEPVLSLLIFSTIGSIYIAIMIIIKRKLRKLNKDIVRLHPEVLRTLKEGFGGIKEVIIFGLSNYYNLKFAKADRLLRYVLGSKNIIAQLPRILIEGLIIITIGILTWVFVSNSHSIILNLPVIGTVVVGLQRLLPNFQNIYNSWTQMIGSKLEIIEAYTLLNQSTTQDILTSEVNQFKDFNKLEMEAVSFRYKDNEDYVIQNINFSIKKGQKIAIIGPSGNGKSCLLDLMLGFLEPKEGFLKVNNKEINKFNVHSWQKNISYVPQDVFLMDKSLFENITFLNDISSFEEKKLNKIVKNSSLLETIKTWKDGWHRVLGERGINVSGGQKQRIGIARALYKETSVLFLDEATSALDPEIEKKIITNLIFDYPDLTLIAITHRLELLEYFDKVLEIKNQTLK